MMNPIMDVILHSDRHLSLQKYQHEKGFPFSSDIQYNHIDQDPNEIVSWASHALPRKPRQNQKQSKDKMTT